jgi:hypothetical protein
VAVDGGGAGAVVPDDGALALHHGGGERERGEVGSRTRENGGGDAAGIWWGRHSKGGADGKAMGGLPVGCSE